MLEEEEEFDTPQYRIKNLESLKRSVQLRPHTPTFGRAPSTDSFSSMNLSLSFSENYTETKSSHTIQRYKSTSYLLDNIINNTTYTERPVTSKETIDPAKVSDQLKKLYENATPFIEKIVDNSANGINQLIIDILSRTLFLPLSSILHSYRDRKALIIVPSAKFATWIRVFLTESTVMCPEGHSQQQKVLRQISTGRTQVLLCVSNRLSTLSLSTFDIIYVVKSELILDSLTPLFDFHGLLIVHQSPGYQINDDFDFSLLKCETMMNPDLKPKCYPHSIFEANYLDSLNNAIDNDETTVIIVPFKMTIDKIFKKIHGKSTKYENYTGSEKKACVTTIAFLYNIFEFDHYIFVDFPPSLSHLIMSTYVASKVTVFVNIPTAIKLQSLSHNCGIDLPILKQVIQDIFWSVSSSSYRKVNEYCAITTNGIDITEIALNKLIRELTQRNYLKCLPFDHQIINIKILSAIHSKSDILSAISKNRSNVHGFYNIPIINLCQQLNMSPNQLESELEVMASNKVVQYKFNEKAQFFLILKEFKDDEFMSLIKELSQKFNQMEKKKDHQFDLLFTILKNEPADQNEDDDDVLDLIANGKEPPELIQIPHAPVSLLDIKKLLSSTKRGELTPRSIARIFHGISSPIFTASEFARSSFWGKQPEASFKEIMKICQNVACNPDKIQVDENEE